MAKYKQPMGDLLDMLVEECAEIIKEVMKARRFGLDGNAEWLKEPGNKPPRDNIVQELGDLLEVIETMLAKGVLKLTPEILAAAQKRKRDRLREYFTDAL